jgi:hypothetical protein
MPHTETLVAFGWCCQSAHSGDEVYYELQPKHTAQLCPCCHQALSEPTKRRRVMFCKRVGAEIPSCDWFMPPIVCEGVPDEPTPLEDDDEEVVDLTWMDREVQKGKRT